MNVQKLFSRVRSLIGDPNGEYATDAYLFPIANQAHDDFSAEVTNMDVGLDEKVVEIPGVAAGTVDLSNYTNPAQDPPSRPLETMITPLTLEWKVAGDPQENYREARLKDQVRSVANLDIIAGWEWTGGNIELNPCTIPVDLRIRGQFMPDELTDALQRVSPLGSLFVIAYMMAYLVGVRRNNPVFIAEYGKQAARSMDNVEEKFIKATQGKVRRFGRSMRARRTGLGFPRLQP